MRLYGQCLGGYSSIPPSSGSGRAKLKDRIKFLSAYGEKESLVGVAQTAVIPFVAPCIAIPVKAGIVVPAQYLHEEEAGVFNHLSEIILPPEQWPYPLPKPCLMVEPDQ